MAEEKEIETLGEKFKELQEEAIKEDKTDTKTELSEQDLSQIIDTLNEYYPGLGMEDIAALLNLPDESFKLLLPSVIMELEKSFRDPATSMALAAGMHDVGLSKNDFLQFLPLVLPKIEEQLNGKLSDEKVNGLKQILITFTNGLAKVANPNDDVISIPFEKCDERATTPTYAHITDAGMDVYALEDITIEPGQCVRIKTGLKFAIPTGYEIQVRPKSGLTTKTHLRIPNSPGTIDAGFRDELEIIIENTEPAIRKINARYVQKGFFKKRVVMEIDSIEYGQSYTIGAGQKFCQLVPSKLTQCGLVEIDHVNEIGEDRGGGFGSTDNVPAPKGEDAATNE